jgi:hypothetical protein
MNVRLHQGTPDLLALMLWLNGERVDGDGAATFFVANSLAVLKGPTLILPVSRKAHRPICHKRFGSTGGDDVTNKCWAGLRLALSKKREGEKTETQLRASGETIDKLMKEQVSSGLEISFAIPIKHNIRSDLIHGLISVGIIL